MRLTRLSALSAFLNAGLLLRGLLKQGVYGFAPGWGKWIFQLTAANVAMGVLLYSFAPAAADWLAAGLWNRVTWMAMLVVGGGAVYAVVLVLLGLRPRHLKG